MLTLAPWKQNLLAGSWEPEGMGAAFGDFVSLDLSGAVPGWCLLATNARPSDLPNSHVILSDGIHPGAMRPGAAIAAQWRNKVGQNPIGETLREWITHALSTQADATGIASRRPAMTEVGAVKLDVRLGQYSFRDPFRASVSIDLRTSPAMAMLVAEYARLRSGGVDAARVWLGRQQERFDLTDAQTRLLQGEFVSDGQPLPHGTTITESFDKANSTTLGPDQAWTEHLADFSVSANQLAFSAAAHGYCSANVDLGTDHYSQADLPLQNSLLGSNVLCGPTTRTSATGGSGGQACCYAAYLATTTLLRLRKYTGGQTFSEIASAAVTAPTSAYSLRLTANGSSLIAALDGVDKISATDTTIASPQRCGCFIFGNNQRINSWEAGDLAVPGGGMPCATGSKLWQRLRTINSDTY